MRCRVSRFRNRLAGQSALFALVVAVSGCSSDWTRFDSSLYTSATDPAANQAVAANPYPGDLDTTTTASIGGGRSLAGPRPLGDVAPRPVVSDHDGYQPYPANGSNQYGNAQPDYTTRQAYNQTASTASYASRHSGYQPVASSQPIERAPLPQPVSQPAATQQAWQAPSSNAALDRTVTASVDRRATAVSLPDRPLTPAAAPITEPARPAVAATTPAANTGTGRGWTAAGGTTVTLQQGETLFNLSKRYGVPVQELMRANNIADADHVRAGQRIVVPTYVYSRNAPVSAPDANRQTRFARSSTGSLVQPDPARIPTPVRKPIYQAAATPQPVAAEPGYGVDRSIITGSVEKNDEPRSALQSAGGSYTVVAGDTLTGIARRHRTTVSKLMDANALDNSTIRIGQKLAIPGSATAAAPTGEQQTVSGRPSRQMVEPERQTASLDKPAAQPAGPAIARSGDEAPQRSGIGTFRWPVRGRVITNFGERDGDANNDGIDISVPEGTAVKAAENGVVVYAGSELEGFGNLILLRHGGGWITAYAHNKRLDVQRGDVVRRGQIIARSGRTGDAQTPKLHFELRKNSTPVDPMKYLGS